MKKLISKFRNNISLNKQELDSLIEHYTYLTDLLESEGESGYVLWNYFNNELQILKSQEQPENETKWGVEMVEFLKQQEIIRQANKKRTIETRKRQIDKFFNEPILFTTDYVLELLIRHYTELTYHLKLQEEKAHELYLFCKKKLKKLELCKKIRNSPQR